MQQICSINLFIEWPLAKSVAHRLDALHFFYAFLLYFVFYLCILYFCLQAETGTWTFNGQTTVFFFFFYIYISFFFCHYVYLWDTRDLVATRGAERGRSACINQTVHLFTLFVCVTCNWKELLLALVLLLLLWRFANWNSYILITFLSSNWAGLA